MHATHQRTKVPQGTLSGFEVTMDILACPHLASAYLSPRNSFQNRVQQQIIIVSLLVLSWEVWINCISPFLMSGLPQTICLGLHKEGDLYKFWDQCNFYHVLLNWDCTALGNSQKLHILPEEVTQNCAVVAHKILASSSLQPLNTH